MVTGNVPNIPDLTSKGAQAIVRQVEKQNASIRDAAKLEREAEAKRQRAKRNEAGTSGR